MTDITEQCLFITVSPLVLPQTHGGGEVQQKSSDTETLKKDLWGLAKESWFMQENYFDFVFILLNQEVPKK